MEITTTIIAFAFVVFMIVGPIYFTSIQAARKSRSVAGWVTVSVFFGWVAWAVVTIMPRKEVKQEVKPPFRTIF